MPKVAVVINKKIPIFPIVSLLLGGMIILVLLAPSMPILMEPLGPMIHPNRSLNFYKNKMLFSYISQNIKWTIFYQGSVKLQRNLSDGLDESSITLKRVSLNSSSPSSISEWNCCCFMSSCAFPGLEGELKLRKQISDFLPSGPDALIHFKFGRSISE